MLKLFSAPKKKKSAPRPKKLSAGIGFWEVHADAVEEALSAHLASDYWDTFEIKSVHRPDVHGLSVVPCMVDVCKPFPGSIVIQDATGQKIQICVRVISDELAQWTLYVHGGATKTPKVICVAQDGLVLVLETIRGSNYSGPVH